MDSNLPAKKETEMPQRASTPRGMKSRIAALAAAALVGAVLTLGQPAQAADPAADPAAETTSKTKKSPPSVQIDTAKETDADSADKTRKSAGLRFDDDEDFEAISKKMPWVIGLIFLVVGSIFLTPIVLLVGIIWYKLRKARLQNEAMLALAEKGVVAPAQAAEALASGASASAAAPQVYQQAVALRKRVVWSDLRKGVILSTLGLAFSFYWLVSAGEPSWLGLVLLFVGVGYVVLWWLEGRHLERADTGGNAGPPRVSGS
jgi:hypothetical protein